MATKRSKADQERRQADQLEEKLERRGPKHDTGKQDERKAKKEVA